MKTINFIKTASVKQHKAIRTWFIFSVLLIGCASLILIILSLQQWLTLKEIGQEKHLLAQQLQPFATLMSKKKNSLSEQELLQKKLLKITEYIQQPHNPGQCLSYLKATLKDDAHIESFSLNEKSLEIRISAPTTSSLIKIADILAQNNSYTGIGITSLEHKEHNRMTAVLTMHHEQSNVC
jgi:Tfp pilus assembly protein PilN